MREKLIYLLMFFTLLVVASSHTTRQEPHHDISSCQTSDAQQSIQGDIIQGNFFSVKASFPAKITPLFSVNKKLSDNHRKLQAVNLRLYPLKFIGLKPLARKPFKPRLYSTADNDDAPHLLI